MGGLGITPQKPDLIDTFERMLGCNFHLPSNSPDKRLQNELRVVLPPAAVDAVPIRPRDSFFFGTSSTWFCMGIEFCDLNARNSTVGEMNKNIHPGF